MVSQQTPNYTVTGRITNRQGEPLEGLTVHAYHSASKTPDSRLGESAFTDMEGRYKIGFTGVELTSGGAADGGPSVFIRVYSDDDLLGESPFERGTRGVFTIDLQVEPRDSGRDELVRWVQGVVRDVHGDPLAGVIVEAFDRDLRSEQTLGQRRTDKRGGYYIQYFPRQFLKSEKESADLVVKALAADGSLLGASPVLFNAPPEAEVDLVIMAPAFTLSLFERVSKAISPVLEGLKPEELEEDEQHQDLSFLSGETGFAIDVIARFVMAHKLAGQGVVAEFWFAILGGSFFEYTSTQSLEDQLEATLDALPTLNAFAVRKALTRSFNQNEIPEVHREKTDEWVETFLEMVARRLVSGTDEPTFVKSALEDAGITGARKQERFAGLFNEHKALTPELLDALDRDRLFKRTEIADLRTSFELSELTRGDFSVVKMLKQEFGVRQPEQIRTLARRSESEWVDLVRRKHAAGEIELPIELRAAAEQSNLPAAEMYGKMLERQFREAFPTTAFAGGLERAGRNGGAHGLRHAEALGRFLDRHESFELLNTSVDDFLKERVHPDIQPVVEDESFRIELKAVQRVFKLAPTFEATDTLLADGLHSAQKIYRMGESEFVRRYATQPGFTADSARLAWNRAADTHAAVLTVVADFKALEAEALPQVLQNGSQAALSSFPNWDNLFKAGDLCECEHCRSVLSPAAYFADLLMFLKDRKAANPAFTVKDILFRRRPDLGFLELNCDNALTTLPYIDVVCEVLEDVVAAGENDLELAGFTAMPADAATAKIAVEAAFAAAGITLGENFTLSQVSPSDPNRWVAHGDDVTYLLKKKATPDFFAEILRNTKASADELRAYPQYVNPKTYDKLRGAKYPLTLPFDLFAEEVRAAFQKTNLQRWDLMRAFRGAAPPNNPGDGDIAAEYFGISADPAATFDEKRLILVADSTIAGQQAVWGATGAGWLTTVGNVKNFLQKTGLEYNDLLALLDLKFINLAGDIVIEHLDPSCDTDKKRIAGLDAPKLDRIHRFLRLWRKLKSWKMWELDLVIRHLNPALPALDEPFLVQLFYFGQLRNRLGKKATIEQTLALFNDLNTETRFTELHEKRAEALYGNLFLNRRLINPLDPAFKLDPGTGDLPVGETITAHHAVVLAALGIREADLLLFKELTKASDGAPYITDALTLANLSFLWRHAWLAKQLKLKVEDWKTVLKLFGQDIEQFANPQAAWEFVESVDHLKASGFTPDDLNWLMSADREAKAAVKEADAARFLTALRRDLQAIKAEHDPAQYSFLTAIPPTDTDGLTALLTSLLQKLNRDEASTQFFISTLRNEVIQEKMVVGLPAGFTFPAAITGAPNNIPIRYEPTLRFSGAMTAAQRTTLLTHPSLAAVTGLPAYQQAIQDLFEQPGQAVMIGLPAGFTFPAAITGAPNNIPIRYEPVLRFTGLMTVAEQTTLLSDASLTAVTGIPAYQEVIGEFFTRPRLALKFFDPIFTAPLANLPPEVDFKALPDPTLALKISYNAEERLLRFAGIMRNDERDALEDLSADAAYRNAVNSLATQPVLLAPPDERIWLLDADLLFPLRDLVVPANDHLAENLANAITKALAYLSKTLSENAVVQQSSAQLALTEALTRYLLTQYPVLPDTLLVHLTGPFAATMGVVDYATLKTTFDGWFWASRVAIILNRLKITLEELEKIVPLTTASQLLDFVTLPLDSTGAMAPVDPLLRTSRLTRLRDSLPETQITLLEVLEKLNNGEYATEADFAADVELLNEAWPAAEVEALVASLDIAYPADYLLAESWERLRRAFYFIENLNAGANVVKTFAATAMGDLHASALKEMLRSKFGSETWLTLSTEIQDVLRERKRDALAAYLLTQPQPADAPSGKWENTNDLYAYYLLDVEMNSCMLTSRLVQGSGSVQLFVQRCFMGLEPDVEVVADGDTGDSAWRWWKWMRKYRVWEANRKVFLWPENWIEPELKKDRSQFFRDLENELLQNEVDQYSVETAFQNYLEKLNGVAQLEIAGFYQEDDGDDAIIHVFGRTVGAEPHLYYYRRYDYRQWTPWEKVDLDIVGDYLIPAVVNNRLFLFWPIFTEVPDEAGNSTVNTPQLGQSGVAVPKTSKKLKMQMAMSEYRKEKWTPKKVSKDAHESSSYNVEIARKHYVFYPIDRSQVDGRFGIKYSGYSADSNGSSLASLTGAFEITGCTGAPERANIPGNFAPTLLPEWESTGHILTFHKWVELEARHDNPQNDFTLANYFAAQSDSQQLTEVLRQTPWLFKMTSPWHLSYMDKLLLDGLAAVGSGGRTTAFLDRLTPLGSWLPYFYNDKKRTFFVLPSFGRPRGRVKLQAGGDVRYYYPDIKKGIRWLEDFFEGLVQTWINTFNWAGLTPAQRQTLEGILHQQFPEEAVPPYKDEQVKSLSKRWLMRYFHYFLGILSLQFFQFRQFHFKNYYHPFVCDFITLAYNPLKGINALMSRETQLKNSGFSFNQVYQPTYWVVEPGSEDYYPEEIVDFTPDGAYSPYNWELFFHAPLLIANSLSRNQRFEEARDWYHYIFNPIGVESATPGGSPMSKYWITKPFFETTDPQYIQQRIDNIMRMLAGDTGLPGFSPQAKKDLEDQVLDWRTNPFEPHRIANYRTVAYQKTVIMKYLDNLVAWGDYLFRQDSMESINEATQLYIMAAEILGPRPKKVPPQVKAPVESFNELETELDKFSNALVEVENLVPALSGTGSGSADPAPLPTLYFCIPRNDKMVGYWDTVADRLYKIRNCMNIEGVVRQLSLFEPPIDPGALVKAVAGGVDISSALADLNAPLPLYRFNILLQKANEVCNDVKALGNALLAALEKKDAEALALLRQSHEIRLLEAVKAVREQQIEEAKENLEGLKKGKELVTIRRDYYQNIERINASERLHQDKLEEALIAQQIGQVINIAASIAHAVPTFDIGASGVGGSPRAAVMFGGPNIGHSLQSEAGKFNLWGNAANYQANKASINAGHERRWDDWKLQESLANKELEQLDRQIAAAELRIALAEKELDNHVLQIENTKATDDFMRQKYTNKDLYQWQVGQISGVYFQSYRLAYDLAKRAERCFRFELGLQDSSYINFGYWDSLRKGLLSGDKLQYDLRRLESAYLDRNRREFELTKHVSLAMLDPLALVKLRETGRCFFRLPEEIFDLDYPGHYFRRIKSVSLTLPSVVGPYTTVTCSVRLLKNSIRTNTANGDNGYARNTDDDGRPADDDRFVENNIPVKAIATSNAQNDSGVFELSFRDERYLPFEGAGAVSEWSLELFSDLPSNNPDPANPDFGKSLRQFDYGSISDAVLHVKYTAREDAGAFKNSAVTHLRDYFSQDGATPAFRMLSLRQEFPSQWHRFLHPTVPADGNVFELDMSPDLFPMRDLGKTLKVNTVWILARCTDAGSYTVAMTPPLPAPPPAGSNTMALARVNQYGGLHFGTKDVSAMGIEIVPTDPPITWRLRMTRPGGGNLIVDPVTDVMEVEDVIVVLGYEWE
jgi:hypothetical protein